MPKEECPVLRALSLSFPVVLLLSASEGFCTLLSWAAVLVVYSGVFTASIYYRRIFNGGNTISSRLELVGDGFFEQSLNVSSGKRDCLYFQSAVQDEKLVEGPRQRFIYIGHIKRHGFWS
ncbi:hypothetical protein BJ166DRAFT_497973 [Pestalotiopsis sp. NC0098]|nr:hypothetical protein BJ166DRAFT_497973 [Pestalotiopsis sp. NC0098]